MDDNRIVELYLLRDETAIKQTTEKYGSRLRSLACGIVNDQQTAEECENDTYMEAWNTIPPHEPRSYLYAFLARITRHISLNCCRDRNRLKRSAFIWYWYLDSIAAISERFALSESKVKTMLFRCRNQLREHLEKEGYIL